MVHLIPRGPYLKQLAVGLVLGKLLTDIGVYSRPRFSVDDEEEPKMRALQVELNKLTRILTGSKILDEDRIEVLLHKSGLESVNRMAVYTTAVEAWPPKF